MVKWNEELELFGEKFTSEGKPITLKKACINALGAFFEDEKNLEAHEKMLRFKLSLLIDSLDETETSYLTPENTERLKKCVSKMYAPSVMGLIFSKVDPSTIQ